MNIKQSLLFSCLLIAFVTRAQQYDEQKYPLTTSVSTYGYSNNIEILDPYLSPLYYTGKALKYNNLERRFVSWGGIPNLSSQISSDWLLGATLNPAGTATILYYGQNFGRGLHYHYKPQPAVQLLLGGIMDLDMGLKLNDRNINNPLNVDLAGNLNLSGILMYDFNLFKRTMQLQLSIQSPLMGCMFVPLQGASYYEMFLLGDISNTMNFSSLHNKQGLNTTISLDLPLNYSVWRFGLNFQDLKYSANDMVFSRSAFSLIVGTTFDFVTFAGRKNKAPKNFISTKEFEK
jgi:hypothetical protein